MSNSGYFDDKFEALGECEYQQSGVQSCTLSTGMLAIKKRAFKTPSFTVKGLDSTDSLILPQPVETGLEAAPCLHHKPAARRRRLLVCPAVGSKEERTLGLKVQTDLSPVSR